MANFYALSSTPLPEVLLGTDSECSIRTLHLEERIAIEDFFFLQGTKLELNADTTALVVSQDLLGKASLQEFGILSEFVLAVPTVSGFSDIGIVATLNDNACAGAYRHPPLTPEANAVFPKNFGEAAMRTWLRHFLTARGKSEDKLHITADRFVRYLKATNSQDGLVDLCICLESLIESQTEISFRFSTCLAKVMGGIEAEEISSLLGGLYDLRSKVVHGTDASKAHSKLSPNLIRAC